MNTKLIFDQDGVQVYQTDNKDARGKKWHLSHGKIGCSVGFKPECDTEWIKEYLAQYMREKKESEEGIEDFFPAD